MPNGDIKQYLTVNPNANRVQLIHEIALGMLYIHGKNVIHGDLKRVNILIDDALKARIADFGLSEIKQHATSSMVTRNSHIASSGAGTLRYMSPEALHGVIDKASDVYAFAMTIYEVQGDVANEGEKLWEIIDLLDVDAETPTVRVAKREEGEVKEPEKESKLKLRKHHPGGSSTAELRQGGAGNVPLRSPPPTKQNLLAGGSSSPLPTPTTSEPPSKGEDATVFKSSEPKSKSRGKTKGIDKSLISAPIPARTPDPVNVRAPPAPPLAPVPAPARAPAPAPAGIKRLKYTERAPAPAPADTKRWVYTDQRGLRRHNIILKIIEQEEEYIKDLDFLETNYIQAIRDANPPVIPADEVDLFLKGVFGNILELREINKELLDNLYRLQQGQKLVKIGDVFLTAATKFKQAYPRYVGHLPLAEERLKKAEDERVSFALFLIRSADVRRCDLRHLIIRPSDHLKNYPFLLESVIKDTIIKNSDLKTLMRATQIIRDLSNSQDLATAPLSSGSRSTDKGDVAYLQLDAYKDRPTVRGIQLSRQPQLQSQPYLDQIDLDPISDTFKNIWPWIVEPPGSTHHSPILGGNVAERKEGWEKSHMKIGIPRTGRLPKNQEGVIPLPTSPRAALLNSNTAEQIRGNSKLPLPSLPGSRSDGGRPVALPTLAGDPKGLPQGIHILKKPDPRLQSYRNPGTASAVRATTRATSRAALEDNTKAAPNKMTKMESDRKAEEGVEFTPLPPPPLRLLPLSSASNLNWLMAQDREGVYILEVTKLRDELQPPPAPTRATFEDISDNWVE
ncbi:hypothetical protein FRB94_000900 [Tulasnella sp. JGI-2019a]|nr:hypothetical protein FRB94_000900 [Tulasnella sp. JGI-2019a]